MDSASVPSKMKVLGRNSRLRRLASWASLSVICFEITESPLVFLFTIALLFDGMAAEVLGGKGRLNGHSAKKRWDQDIWKTGSVWLEEY